MRIARLFTILLIAFPLMAQTPDPVGWLTVASASATYATTPSVTLPTGTVYRFWGTSAAGVTTYCPTQVATAAPILVWVGPCPGATTDYAYNGNHSLEVQEGPTPLAAVVTTPEASGEAAISTTVTVPIIPGTTTPPVTTPATNSVTFSMSLTFQGTPVTATCTAVPVVTK